MHHRHASPSYRRTRILRNRRALRSRTDRYNLGLPTQRSTMKKPSDPQDPLHNTRADQDTPTREAPTNDEERIDESIDESFPASDPPAVHPSVKR